jgi:hypothetical protein
MGLNMNSHGCNPWLQVILDYSPNGVECLQLIDIQLFKSITVHIIHAPDCIQGYSHLSPSGLPSIFPSNKNLMPT